MIGLIVKCAEVKPDVPSPDRGGSWRSGARHPVSDQAHQ